ncbi:hypothetical protein GCM10010339_72680 [Streptomyces alanosinicus]|uniref:Uncharacterized protein n=1 Tax=Streptomyces alanosinicus TaxID=68171 RepID=A0A918YQW9_9ACTN|nr:hypothetical protein GCM10010339_72680 [Streptomyces alanosinicus]
MAETGAPEGTGAPEETGAFGKGVDTGGSSGVRAPAAGLGGKVLPQVRQVIVRVRREGIVRVRGWSGAEGMQRRGLCDRGSLLCVRRAPVAGLSPPGASSAYDYRR